MTPTTITRPQRDYTATLGGRLRRVRLQQRLSLHDVEERSDGTFKASVLSAYERGERTLSVTRLRQLAGFYRVPLGQLMPGETTDRDHPPVGGVCIDLDRLQAAEAPELSAVSQFVSGIAERRGDYNGKVITIRREDLRALAAAMDHHPVELRDALAAAGVVEDVSSRDGPPSR